MSADQIVKDMTTPKFLWDHPSSIIPENVQEESISFAQDPNEAVNSSHAICVLTEWDEFKTYDYEELYSTMMKPAFIFDGRNILDHDKLRKIGFIVYAMGKPLDPFLVKS